MAVASVGEKLGKNGEKIGPALGPWQALRALGKNWTSVGAVVGVARTFHLMRVLCHDHSIRTVAYSCIARNDDFKR